MSNQYSDCRPWQLSESCDATIIDQYVADALAIAGAPLNIFKLLGVHEQGKLVDLAGSGKAISGGTANGFNASNAFVNSTCSHIWRSAQQGNVDVLKYAYIGYDFGVPKLSNGRNRYGVDVNKTEHITTIRISQSENPNRRVQKIRVERSDDNIKWFGVDIIQVPDDDNIHQISFKQSAASRYWRLRPLNFNGGALDFWEVQSIELIDWALTNLFQSEDDYGLIENRTRDYASNSIMLKGYYDLYEKESELMSIGFSTSGSIFYITCSFTDAVNRLGRPVVIGDVIEVPSEAQFDPNLKSIKKYLEVTDVSWSAEGYTPGWKPTMLRVVAEPMMAKPETMDIVGDMTGAVDQSGLFDLDETKYTNIHHTSPRIHAAAQKDVPQRGSDTSEITSFEQEDVDKYAAHGINISNMGQNQNALYVEDAIPPNGLPYTESDVYPANPKNKDYHRLTYTGLAKGIPARLFRYSSAKGRWVFVETDRRYYNDATPPLTQRMKNSDGAVDGQVIGKQNKSVL